MGIFLRVGGSKSPQRSKNPHTLFSQTISARSKKPVQKDCRYLYLLFEELTLCPLIDIDIDLFRLILIDISEARFI